MPRVQDAIPSLDCRAWKGRSNLLFLSALRFAPESRGGARVAAMREKIKAGGHVSPYRLRKQLPEPVFGQIKQARGFRQFLLRGVEKVAAEWAVVCIAHNIS